MSTVLPDSVVICPHCGHSKRETMPTDACLFFYECERCKSLLRAKPGDCCVFCSFGSTPCPPVQVQRAADLDHRGTGGKRVYAERERPKQGANTYAAAARETRPSTQKQ